MERFVERDELARGAPLVCQYAAREFQARLDRLRPAVAEERARQSGQLRQALGQLSGERMEEQVRRVDECLRLLGDRAGQPWMRVTQRRDADAGQQIDILAAVRVVETDALAADERHRVALVDRQHVFRFACYDVVHHHRHRSALITSATIRVALSWDDASRRRLERRPIPSIHDHHFVDARGQRVLARAQLGDHPAVAVPLPTNAATAAPSTVDTVFPFPSSTPGVVPATISRRAPSCAARCPANVSAFTLNSWPSAPMPMHAITGTNPAEVNTSSSRVSAAPVGMPTRPRSTVRPSVARCSGAVSDRPHSPSAPVNPTAPTPAVLSAATSRVLTAPASTATTTSSVASSVIRRPSTCRFSTPAVFSAGVDLLAAAVDDDHRSAGGNRADGRNHVGELRPILEQLAAEFDDHYPGVCHIKAPPRRTR
mgnify:CR=1 FL=1